MNFDEKIVCGITGTVVSATGASLSTTDIQAIISIIVTIAGFIIGVLIPTVIKIVKKVKEAKADGVITKEEKEEIIKEVKDGIEEIKEGAKDVEDSIKK